MARTRRRTKRTIQVKSDAGWRGAVAVLTKQRGIPLHFLDREVTIKAAFSVAAHCFHRAELQAEVRAAAFKKVLATTPEIQIPMGNE